MAAKLEDTLALTKEIIHGYYGGDTEPWFSRLCSKSVWVGTGERLLMGGDTIRSHFEGYAQRQPADILREEYYPIPMDARCGAVVAEVTVGDTEGTRVTSLYTFLYQVIGGETKLVLQQSSYEFILAQKEEDEDTGTGLSAYRMMRDILLDMPEQERIAVPRGKETLYIQPHMILYVRSKNKKTEFHCLDTVIQSRLTISAVSAMLPEDFCSIHRCYTVNTRYVTDIRRYEATLVTGEKLPLPFHAYNEVKADLERRISGQKHRAEQAGSTD